METAPSAPGIELSPWLLGVLGGVSLIAGILVIAYPDVTLLALAIIAGVNLLLLGVIGIVDAAVADADSSTKLFGVLLGILSVLAGLVVIRRPGESLLAIVVVLGIWFVIAGILDAVRALVVPGNRGLRLLAAAAHVVLGILILSLPKLSLATLAVLIGIGFIVRGVVGIVAALQLRRTRRGPPAAPATA